MAGLPKVALHLGAMVLIGAILVVGGLSRAQETPGALTLEDLIARIEAARTLSAEEKSQVVGSLSTAVTGGCLTTAQALAWLDAVQLEALTPKAVIAVEALTMTVAAVTTGRVDPEGALTALAVATTAQDLALLKTMLAELAAPPGINQALANVATATDHDEATITTLLDETQELILDGVPPGIVPRLAKDALRSQTNLTTLQVGLATLGTLIADGTARAARQIKSWKTDTVTKTASMSETKTRTRVPGSPQRQRRSATGTPLSTAKAIPEKGTQADLLPSYLRAPGRGPCRRDTRHHRHLWYDTGNGRPMAARRGVSDPTPTRSRRLPDPKREDRGGWPCGRRAGQCRGPRCGRLLRGPGVHRPPRPRGSGAVFMDAEPEAIRTSAAFHAAHGTMTLCAAIIPALVDRMRQAMAAVAEAAEPGIAGLYLEGPFVSPAKKGAFNTRWLRPPRREPSTSWSRDTRTW